MDDLDGFFYTIGHFTRLDKHFFLTLFIEMGSTIAKHIEIEEKRGVLLGENVVTSSLIALSVLIEMLRGLVCSYTFYIKILRT